MKYWVMKSEPEEFSIDDLKSKGQELWEGVRNYQVRNMFRDEMAVGDQALFYHSSTKKVGIVGEMKIIKVKEVDPTQFDHKSKYFDAKSSPKNPRWFAPTVAFVSKFAQPLTLSQIKLDPIFEDSPLVKKGNRLSAFPIGQELYQAIIRLSK